jgi:hypothetical protein
LLTKTSLTRLFDHKQAAKISVSIKASYQNKSERKKPILNIKNLAGIHLLTAKISDRTNPDMMVLNGDITHSVYLFLEPFFFHN